MQVLYCEDFPATAIGECSSPGPADEAVEYWVNELNFDVDRDAAVVCLRGYGAWSDEELSDHDANVRRIFWLAMCTFAEGDSLFVIE